MTNYFRMDGWVKTTTGAAIPGAQIYVCTQPANAVVLPPSPLANIFSDVNGLVPITQPILTDGFGHYDFYAQAAAYTIVVGFAGQVQQVYPDQSIGGASGSGGGGTGLALQVNGTPNGNQLLLNLQGAGSVTVADNGSGTVTVTGTVFKTNGTQNTLQSVYNLKAGSNITLSADGVGGVTVNGASGLLSGTNVWPGGANGFASANYAQGVFASNTVANCLPGRLAYCLPSSWKVTLASFAGNTVKLDACSIAICNADSGIVNSVVPVTFAGIGTATYTTTVTSDPINIQIDVDHDYYLLVYYDSTSGNPGYWQNCLVPASGTYSPGAEYSSVNNTNPANVLTTHTPSTQPFCFYKNIKVA